jgi:hypothetical protein
MKFTRTKTPTVATILGINYTTPGLVALGVHLVRFFLLLLICDADKWRPQVRWALSADMCFVRVGDQTGNNWFDDFDEHMEILTVGLANKDPRVLKVFQHWDLVIFGRTESSHGQARTDNATARRLNKQRALSQIQPATVEHDENHSDPETP